MNALGLLRRWWLCGVVIGLFAAPLAAKDRAPPKGQRVFSCGHSFHMFMPPILAEISKAAGIADHQQVGTSGIGGSYIHQHWDKEGEKSAKAVIPAEKPDVLTLSPIYLPDDGIENFARLVAEKSPATRIYVQEFWLPYDVYDVEYKKQRPATPDRDAATAESIRSEHEKYFRVMDEHVRALNKRLGRTVLYVTPVGQAVVALREKVIAGEAPGIAKQSELFTDAIGHVNAPIKALNAYCHYAAIYGRSPVGLPVPTVLKGFADEETTAKLNRLLQELAWQAVTSHPLSGVKPPADN